MKQVVVYPAQKGLSGNLKIPGDKSISHRAILLAALSEGSSRIQGLLEAEDVLCTIDCLRALGVKIEKEGDVWCVEGVGLKGLKPPQKTLWCGNSGTAMRLLLGVLAAQDFESSLTGDASLNRRPMKRVTDPLTQMGAQFSFTGEGTEKRLVHVKGAKLKGITYHSPVASAQIKSAILLASLWAEGETTVIEPSLSRDHSERMLAASGLNLKRSQNSVSTQRASVLKFPSQFRVPADISSAAFFAVAALLVPDSQIILEKIGLNPTRTGLLDAFQQMGAHCSVRNPYNEGGEEMGDLEVSFSSLRAFTLKGSLIPRLIDEIPILGVAAAQASGVSEISDAQELRVKESDRLRVLADLLGRLGVRVEEKKEGMSIQGRRGFKAAVTESFGDHRMVMSMAVAALVAEGPVQINDISCVDTSFPQFWSLLQGLGVRCEF